MQINVVARADVIEAYVASLAVDVLGEGATVRVVFSEPDDCGMVCALGEAHAAGG